MLVFYSVAQMLHSFVRFYTSLFGERVFLTLVLHNEIPGYESIFIFLQIRYIVHPFSTCLWIMQQVRAVGETKCDPDNDG